ncbi:MAG TPA: hypothetical protein VFA99_05090 [Acidobacteriaceae bacterium]|nr:hypothetical protein [Acidobacteriaceae bacterium]
MSGWRMGCAVVMLGALASGGAARAQNENAPGCTLVKQVYTCDWQAFVHRLEKAKTVSIETHQIDRFTARQLRELIGELGKSVAPEGSQGDLTMLLIPMQSTGIHIGQTGEPLATLRIYAPLPGTPRGTLLWAETYTGQPDRPWPMTVHALIEQFKDRVQRR